MVDDLPGIEAMRRYEEIRSMERDVRAISRGQKGIDFEVPWPRLHSAALFGIAGEFVNIVGPHTEADPAALLFQFLTSYGNVVGPSAYVVADGNRHPCRLFVGVVGETSKARKGTSWAQVMRAVGQADEKWAERVTSGLSSGEGLVAAVQDNECEAVDKRLMVVKGEFARTLRVMEREGSTLSALMRQAWDSGNLSTLTKHPMMAKGAHISIVGHITKAELVQRLSRTEQANGFGNRFLWICVKRSKILPFGGNIDQEDFGPFLHRLKAAISHARSMGEVRWASETRPLWEKEYAKLSEGRPGIIGSMTARGEAQTLRLALIYALLDRKNQIEPSHLVAALAAWEYTEKSVRYVFHDPLGNVVAETIYQELEKKLNGLTRTQIRDLFQRHKTKDDIDAALDLLETLGLAKREQVQTGGRPKELWIVTSLKATRAPKAI